VKLRYFLTLLSVVIVFSLIAYANTDSLKKDFFDAQSFLDADVVKIFDGICEKGKITEFFVEDKTDSSDIRYYVYSDGEKHFIESPDNFGYTILTDGSDDEILAPFDVISFFFNSSIRHTKYSRVFEFYESVIRNSVTEDDFRKQSTYVKIGSLRKKCDTVTLNVKGSAVISGIKKFLGSDDFVSLVNDVYDCKYTSDDMLRYADVLIPYEEAALIHKRSIVGGKIISENIVFDTGSNVYTVKVANDYSEHPSITMTFSDSGRTVCIELEYKKTYGAEELTINTKDELIKLVKTADSLQYCSEAQETTKIISVRPYGDYIPENDVFGMNILRDKRLIFTKLSRWLRGNADAALLFRTYEADINPLDIKTEDLKIIFDE